MSIELSRFRYNLTSKCGVSDSDLIIVAMSGGADSVTLAHLLQKTRYNIIIAHCNFNLRGNDSLNDQKFVENYCLRNKLTLEIKHFNTLKYSRKNGISIEMAARELRYNWFYDLIIKYNAQWVATGHHANDNIETFFINLSRGTGLKGLSGMEPVNDKIIRPLLYSTKNEILEYCSNNALDYVTDVSNDDTAIKRNKIRKNLIPLFEELNPSFLFTMIDNLQRLSEVEMLMEKVIDEELQKIITIEDEHILVPIRLIKNHPAKSILLHELLRNKGFNTHQIPDIIRSLDRIPGKQFNSEDYRLIIDRYNLIIHPLKNDPDKTVYINSETDVINNPIHLTFEVFATPNDFHFSKSAACIHVDADAIEYPLTLRHWQQGDSFRPLGMKQFKKVSDFFIDEKLNLLEKEETWILTSGDNIIWIVGQRIDDRFKVTEKTKQVLEIKLI